MNTDLSFYEVQLRPGASEESYWCTLSCKKRKEFHKQAFTFADNRLKVNWNATRENMILGTGIMVILISKDLTAKCIIDWLRRNLKFFVVSYRMIRQFKNCLQTMFFWHKWQVRLKGDMFYHSSFDHFLQIQMISIYQKLICHYRLLEEWKRFQALHS